MSVLILECQGFGTGTRGIMESLSDIGLIWLVLQVFFRKIQWYVIGVETYA